MSNIIITGANRGIGYYLAEGLLTAGHTVAVLDVETVELGCLKEKYGERLLPVICDVRDAEGIKRSVGHIADSFQDIDIAIHNACCCPFSSMAGTEEEAYQSAFDVNYYGALRLAKAVIPYMEAKQRGKVIFTSSGVGVTGFPNISAYASSKGAIEALAKCLATEYLKKGISFHIFHPPLTRTRSSEPFPLPKEFMADPRRVGYGLAKHIGSKSFVICHSLGQRLQTRLCYLFSLRMGLLLSEKMASFN